MPSAARAELQPDGSDAGGQSAPEAYFPKETRFAARKRVR